MGKKSRAIIKFINKSKSIKIKLRKINPSIFEFDRSSNFIYEPRLSLGFYKIMENNNLMKPSSYVDEKLSK